MEGDGITVSQLHQSDERPQLITRTTCDVCGPTSRAQTGCQGQGAGPLRSFAWVNDYPASKGGSVRCTKEDDVSHRTKE